MLWKIAKDAEKIDRLAIKHWGAAAASAGGAVDSVLSTQESAIEASRQAVASRVVALEGYARDVRAIDDLLAQHSQLEELEKANQDYLDLLAETSGDTSSVQRIQEAGQEAAVMSGPLVDAVQRAREAAELVLPGGD
ncbi:hypothetical protein [Streptomyces sp. AK08-02]|uniref:hypothetical protein n=1 Tax=Streptomyces sp. AK08-02 TaxID=3028654 RepID=UPI0029BD6442|nr:hypothetical protein [Streptomyces sp. AK08-02]MDX3749628.1 hypothetical protein [Streptomyces sp. AK08-02]